MKSHDILILFKIASIQQQRIDHVVLNTDVINPLPSQQNWLGEPQQEYFVDSDEGDSRLFSVRALESATGISKTQVNLSLHRMYEVGLLKQSRLDGLPLLNSKALTEFIAYGIRYVFPAEMGKPTRGIPTALSAPVIRSELVLTSESVPVWPHHQGQIKGYSVAPLHENVAQAIKSDSRCYAFLALTDAIRLGQPRERKIALSLLEKLLGQPL